MNISYFFYPLIFVVMCVEILCLILVTLETMHYNPQLPHWLAWYKEHNKKQLASIAAQPLSSAFPLFLMPIMFCMHIYRNDYFWIWFIVGSFAMYAARYLIALFVIDPEQIVPSDNN